MIWINLIDLLGRFAHDAGHGSRVNRLRTLAAGRSGPDLDRNKYGALARPFRFLSRPSRGPDNVSSRLQLQHWRDTSQLIHVNAFTHLNGQRKLTSLIAFPRHLNRSGAAEQSGDSTAPHWSRRDPSLNSGKMESLLEPTADLAWVLAAEGFDPLREAIYKSRFSISNGLLGLRAGRPVSRGERWVRSAASLPRRSVRCTRSRAPHTFTCSRPRVAANPHYASGRAAGSPPRRGDFTSHDTRHEAGFIAYGMPLD